MSTRQPSGPDRTSRRRFLRTSAATAGLWAASPAIGSATQTGPTSTARPGDSPLVQLSPHLSVYHGPLTVGILRDGARAWLIDCGDGSVCKVLPAMGIDTVARVLFTHHHRDQACGAGPIAQAGAKISVPAAERPWFERVADYWNDPKHRWHLYNYHPHHLMLTQPLGVDAVLRSGDELSWGPARIGVLATPGHTDGSVSYVVEVDGRRFVFCGDAICGDGQVWNVHSLQKGFRRGKRSIGDYHGFMGARDELAAGLKRIGQAGPDVLIPSHGRAIEEPQPAIDRLLRRLDVCYERYVAISALRHYFPTLFEEFAGRPGQMPLRPGKKPPPCLRHFGTSWMVVSDSKAALVMDCGHPQRIADIKGLLDKDEITSVEGLWVTHYHDDHVDAIPQFQAAFDCPCYADRHVAEVITHPLAWRLPCISPSTARVDHATEDGHSWNWREFQLTAYFLPGQTLYHGGLLVRRGDLRMLFVGDSFTPGGIDDYCSLNRNWLGDDVGFDHCIRLIEKLRPTHIFNCHVAEAFDFTPAQCRQMRENLSQRLKLFGDLVPWDHANFGLDESWLHCFPYEQQVAGGEVAKFDLVAMNHAQRAASVAARVVRPGGWSGSSANPQTALGAWQETEVPGKSQRRLPLELPVPGDAQPGRYPIAVDVRYGRRVLPQITEAILVVT